MKLGGIDHDLVRAWLTARSVARALPPPTLECGGFRVDTHSNDELVRWVYPELNDGLIELGSRVYLPRHIIKLCGSCEHLRGALPERWKIQEPSYFMRAGAAAEPRTLPDGYELEIESDGSVTIARVRSTTDRQIAARGFAAEAAGAFVYDRIETASRHRRKGLGHAVMAALKEAKKNPETTELLVATAGGRALYEHLGWRVLSLYSTASIPHY